MNERNYAEVIVFSALFCILFFWIASLTKEMTIVCNQIHDCKVYFKSTKQMPQELDNLLNEKNDD